MIPSAYNPPDFLKIGSITFPILKKGMILLVYSSKAESSIAGRFQKKAMVPGKYLD